MKKMITWKRGLAVLLSACMVLGMVPVQTRAAAENAASGNETQTQAEPSESGSDAQTEGSASGNESSGVYALTEKDGAYYDDQHVKYTLQADDGTATVAGYDTSYVNDTNFPAANVETGNGWEITIPAKVSFDGTEYGVTEVGERAFYSCNQLTKTKFPKDSAVEKIDTLAFYSCSLGEITLPDSLTSIGDLAFYSNTRLKYIYIPKNVSEIKSMICFECTALTRIEISPENEKYYISDASNCIIDSDRLTQGCSTSVLPKGRNITINIYSFAGMDITKVDFTGVYISEIERFAFRNAQLPENWVLPVASSGNVLVVQLAFYASNGLKKVTIPDNVCIYPDALCKQDDALNTDLGSSIFSKCSSLEQVVIPKTLKLDSRICDNTTNYDFFRGCNSEKLTAYVEAGADDYLMTALKNYAKEDWTGGKTTPTTNENGHFILKDAYRVQFAEDYEGYTLAKAKGCATLVPIPGDSATFTITADEGYKTKPIVKVGKPGLTSEEVAALSPVSYDETKDGYTITVDKDHYVVYLENYGKCGHSGKSAYTLQNDESGNSILTKVCDECGNVETGIVTAVWRHGIRQADSIAFSCDNINMKGTFTVTEDVVDGKDVYSYKFTPTDGNCTGNGSVTVATLTEESFGHTTNGITYSTVKSEKDINTPLGNYSADIYYDSEQSILHINGSETYVVSGTTKKDRIVVNNTKPVTLVLNGIDIQMTDLPAIDLQGTADVKLVLADEKENILESTGNYAALQKNDLASDTPKLIIDGMGSLSASAENGAAIGAETKKTSSNIVFNNGHITVESTYGSGIGNGSNVTVEPSTFSPKDFIFNGGIISSKCKEAINAYDISGGITVNGGAVYIGTAFLMTVSSECNEVNEGFMSRYSNITNQYVAGMKGNVTIDLQFCGNGLEIPKNTTLTIGANGRMYTEKGTVTNNGTLIIKGYTTDLDSLQNNGTIYNYSRSDKSLADKVTGSGTLHEDIDHDGLCDICGEDIGNVNVSYDKDVTVMKGDTLTLSADVTPKDDADKEITYQWYELDADGNYTEISGATTAKYVQKNCSLEVGEHTYRLQALCDGIIRYIPFTVHVTKPLGVHLAGYSLSLSGNIGVNFYMELSEEVIGNKEAYMNFSLPNGTSQKVYVTGDHTDGATAVTDITVTNGTTYYVFTCEVAAKEMTSDIKAQIIAGDKKGTEYTYTVKDYADYILSHAADSANDGGYDAETVALVKAMLYYGGSAQKYFGYHTEKLASDGNDLSGDITKDWMNGEKYKTVIGGDREVCTFQAAYLSLKSTTDICVYVKLAEGVSAEQTKFYIGDTLVTPEKTTYDGKDCYKLTVTGVKAKNLASMYTFKVVVTREGEESKTATLSYGAFSYAKTVFNSKYDSTAGMDKLRDVMNGMYLYYNRATAYAAKHSGTSN